MNREFTHFALNFKYARIFKISLETQFGTDFTKLYLFAVRNKIKIIDIQKK